MLGFALVILFLFTKTLANTHVNQSLNNGWVPLTHADVLNQTKTGVYKRNYDVSWSQAISYFDISNENASKILPPQPSSNKEIFYYSPPDTPSFDTIPINGKKLDKTLKHSNENEIFTNIPDLQNEDKFRKNENDTETTTEHNQRQSKQIDNNDILSDIQNLLYDKVIEGSHTEAASTTSIGKYINVKEYEVTEPSNVEEITQKTDKYNHAYIYKPPVVVPIGFNAVRNDITKKLYNNLRKYNIKPNDLLNNYAVSKEKVNHFNTMFNKYRNHFQPVVPVPFRYNSLNHLPVNPLLAVFLSNYGYYTKDSYGLQNNYKNLYGYTASNNIHNNYPFGSYKIFADTDSSH